MTVKVFAPAFLSDYRANDQKPAEGYAKKNIVTSHLVPFFGPLRLDEIDQGHLDAFAGAQANKVSKRTGRTLCAKTINNRLTILKTRMDYAVARKKLTGFAAMSPNLEFHLNAHSPMIPAVPKDDVVKLKAVATTPYKAAIELATEAGLRVGDLRGLQHGDVKAKPIEIRRAIDQGGNVGLPKNGKHRRVSLSPGVRDALAALPKRGIWVLSTPEGESLRYEVLYETIVQVYAAAKVTLP